jgi:hypothetical protein
MQCWRVVGQASRDPQYHRRRMSMEQPTERKKMPPRRKRGIFEREAIAIMVLYLGLPVVGFLLALALPLMIRWGVIHPLPEPPAAVSDERAR